jgi:hypothetical protein
MSALLPLLPPARMPAPRLGPDALASVLTPSERELVLLAATAPLVAIAARLACRSTQLTTT